MVFKNMSILKISAEFFGERRFFRGICNGRHLSQAQENSEVADILQEKRVEEKLSATLEVSANSSGEEKLLPFLIIDKLT